MARAIPGLECYTRTSVIQGLRSPKHISLGLMVHLPLTLILSVTFLYIMLTDRQ